MGERRVEIKFCGNIFHIDMCKNVRSMKTGTSVFSVDVFSLPTEMPCS